MTLLNKPSVVEIEFILERCKNKDVYYRRMHRKLNDLRGEYKGPDNKMIPKKFIEYAGDKLGLSTFDAVLCYNYIIRMVDITKPKWSNITKFLHEHEYIESPTNKKGCFHTLREGLKWIVSYRYTKMYFDYVIKNLDYDGSWVTNRSKV